MFKLKNPKENDKTFNFNILDHRVSDITFKNSDQEVSDLYFNV